MVNGNTYVSMLPEDIKKDIENNLMKYYIHNHDYMTIFEVAEHVQNGLASRLNDLESLIDIRQYIEDTTIDKTLQGLIDQVKEVEN